MHATQCVRPAVQYFLRRFKHVEGVIFPLVAAIKAARLCSSKFIHQTRPHHSQVDAIRSFPALNDDEAVHELKPELPANIAATGAITTYTATDNWWCRQEEQGNLPSWRNAAKLLFTCYHLRLLRNVSSHCCSQQHVISNARFCQTACSWQ